LVELLGEGVGGDTGVQRLIDVQWQTPHLASLGVEEISRDTYLAMLPALIDAPLPRAFDSVGAGQAAPAG
jgi:Leu/Phe-tRNA-protein transferase